MTLHYGNNPEPKKLSGVILIKKVCFLIFILILSACGQERKTSSQVQGVASSSIIFGSDDRVNLSSSKEKYKSLGRSVAVMIGGGYFGRTSGSHVELLMDKVKPLTETDKICADEKFADNPTLSKCTGFLISDDLILTAGHCLAGDLPDYTAHDNCLDFDWVFDFVDNNREFNRGKVSKENVYRCKEVVDVGYADGVDYAIVRLNRPVKNRKPLKLSFDQNFDTFKRAFLIGSSIGSPLKLVPNSDVFEAYHDSRIFNTRLDTFSSMSGAPVFNEKTLKVEGLHISGDSYTLVHDKKNDCYRYNRECEEDESICIKAKEYRIDNIPNLQNLIK